MIKVISQSKSDVIYLDIKIIFFKGTEVIVN